MNPIIQGIFIPLTLTIIIEESICFVFKLFDKSYNLKGLFTAILAVNIITNPTINIILNFFYSSSIFLILLIILELFVIIIEWQILSYIFKKKSKKMLYLSLIMNICSLLFGALIL